VWKRLIVLVLFLLAHPLSLGAQNDFKLRTPTATEYLTTVSRFQFPIWGDNYSGEAFETLDSVNFITREALRRYPILETEEFSLLKSSYNALQLGVVPVEARHTWNIAMLRAWFRENEIDLAQTHELQIDRSTITVDPVDFNGDGTNDYLLFVVTPPDPTDPYAPPEYMAYVVALSTAAGYTLLDIPLPWYGNGFPYWYDQATALTPRRFEDVNLDGTPEWLLDGWRSNTGPGSPNSAYFYILGWHEGQIVSLAPDGAFHALTTAVLNAPSENRIVWDAQNVDADPPLEVIERIQHIDNWYCSSEEVIISQWDAAQYVYVPGKSQIILGNSPGCVWRSAEEAMWIEDYAAAVPLYETFLAEQTLDDDSDLQDRQYVEFRLALAYALTGRPNDATALLNTLSREAPTTPDMGELIETLNTAYQQRDAIALCTAAYNFFARYRILNGGYDGPIYNYVGQTLVDYELSPFNAFPSLPEDSGCDIAGFIDNLISEHPLTLDKPLDDQLTALGIEVETVIHTDLNGDLQEEWIIQPRAQISALFFTPNGGQYDETYLGYKLTENVSSIAYALPDTIGLGLAIIEYDVPPRGSTSDLSCPDDSFPSDQLSIWRQVDHHLRLIFQTLLCEPATFAEIIQNNGVELHIWDTASWDTFPVLFEPAIYTWDLDTQDYEITSVAGQPVEREALYDPYEEPVPTRDTITTDVQGVFGCNPDCAMYWLANFDAVIPTLAPDDASPEILQARYGYAFLLEDSGRTDEALAQYVLIHATAPESIWGQLAVLHFE
jgi:hypothetical protein